MQNESFFRPQSSETEVLPEKEMPARSHLAQWQCEVTNLMKKVQFAPKCVNFICQVNSSHYYHGTSFDPHPECFLLLAVIYCPVLASWWKCDP